MMPERLDLAVVACLVPIWPGGAEAGDRAVDQARVDRPQRRVADAQAIHHAWPEILHNHVRLCGEPVNDVDGGRLLQV
jgi:hypothetical protein